MGVHCAGELKRRTKQFYYEMKRTTIQRESHRALKAQRLDSLGAKQT